MKARERGGERGCKEGRSKTGEPKYETALFYLKGVEEQLTVHPDLPPEPRKGVGQAHEHDVVHPEDQHQDQRRFGEFPERQYQPFYEST